MSLRYGYFDSEITGYDEEGMPIFDRAESSDFFALFISSLVSDGVLANPGDCFQVVAHEGMTLKVRPGFGIIRGRLAYDPQEYTIVLSKAPTSYKRIDRVVLRANYLNRLCEIIVKEGTPDASPVPPELLQPASGDYYELCLATVLINSNQTVITQANITDTRYDSSVCGIVTQLIDHIDTSALYAQIQSDLSNFRNVSQEEFNIWFEIMRDKLSEDAAGSLQSQIGILEGLITSNKDNLVNAINDVAQRILGFDVLDTVEEIEANTIPGIAAGALALKETKNIFGGISQFIVDPSTGEITGYTTEIGGADTVFPFSSNKVFIGYLTLPTTSDYAMKINIGFRPDIVFVYTSYDADSFYTLDYCDGEISKGFRYGNAAAKNSGIITITDYGFSIRGIGPSYIKSCKYVAIKKT